MTKSLLFFKKSNNIDHELNFSDYSTIVPTNFESSRYLDSLKIKYTLPETYVSLREYYEIDQLAIKLGKSLWKIKNEQLISFKQINIPDLYNLENTLTLIKLLKKIFEYNKIIEIETPDEIFTSIDGNTFDDILKLLASNKNIKYHSYYNQIKSTAFFDDIPIQIKLAGTIFSIKPNQFRKIKDIGEFFLKKLPQKQLTKNPLLLIDFNLVLYEYFLEYLEKQGIEVVLLNSRRPAIWNLKSLKIKLSKKYNVDYLSNYNTRDSKNNIDANSEEICKNFLSILQTNSFKSKLKVADIEFADLLNIDFANYFSQKIHESIENIELSSKFLERTFSHILVWAYQLPFEKIILNLASQVNVPVSTIQDGVKGQLYHPSLGETEKFLDYDSNFKNFFAWGTLPQTYFLNAGVPKSKIVLSGSPLYDNHFKLKTNPSLTNSILLATSGLGVMLDSNTVSRMKQYQSYFEVICKTIPTLNQKKLAIKLHPFADERIDIPKIAKKINPNILIYKHENIVNLISNADLVISSYSTVILESMILGKPTMVWIEDVNSEPVELPYIKSGACLKLDLENFESQINDFYTNPKIRKNLLQNSQIFINNYLVNQGQASNFIIDFLK
jgi:hypothetical protein